MMCGTCELCVLESMHSLHSLLIFFNFFLKTVCRMHDHQSGSSEAPTPSPSARPMAAGVKEADPRGMNEDPKAPSGAFEQGRHKFPSDSPGKSPSLSLCSKFTKLILENCSPHQLTIEQCRRRS